MRVVLANSTVMPHEGEYRCRRITHFDFCEAICISYRHGELENYIGYKQNLELIKKWTGVELELNREKMYLEDGDGMLVMKLKYRVQDPTTKGKEVSEDDFEYFYVIYKELEE